MVTVFSKCKYLFSPSLHRDFYQKIIKWFSNYIPNSQNLNQEELHPTFDEKIEDKNFEWSPIEIETYGSIEKLKNPKEYDSNQAITIILKDLHEKESNNPRVPAMAKRWWHKNKSISKFSQVFYKLPKRTITANWFIFYLLEPNTFRDVQNL